MIDDPSVAESFARSAHGSAVDKQGKPYIEHVQRVVSRVARLGDDLTPAAWLHDVCEDCNLTVRDLTSSGLFSNEVVECVDRLTRRSNEDLSEYLVRVLGSPAAATIKRADLTDNSSPHRLAQLPPDVAQRLRTKYASYLQTLGSFSTSEVDDLLPAERSCAEEIRWRSEVDSDPLAVYRAYPLSVAESALRMVADAARAEPEITRTLLRSTLAAHAVLVGLSHRLKSPDRAAEKLHRLMLAGQLGAIHDVNRYTVKCEVNALVQVANNLLEDLRASGWSLGKLKHTYYTGSVYKGVHARLHPPSSGTTTVEIQFHTPESLAAKQSSRALFEQRQQRHGANLGGNSAEVDRERAAIFANVPHPPAIWTITFGNSRIERVRA